MKKGKYNELGIKEEDRDEAEEREELGAAGRNWAEL